mgnify:CR=1 FL=1
MRPTPLVHTVGHHSAEPVDYLTRGLYDGFGLVAKKAGGLDDFLKLGRVGGGERLDVRIPRKKFRRSEVHAFVRALSGQYGGHKQLVRSLEIQRASSIRILPVEYLDDALYAQTGIRRGFAGHFE